MPNTIAWTLFAALLTAGSAYAAELSDCPAVTDIKADKFTDKDMPAPWNEGFKYKASTASGKQWVGETMATADSFLEEKYALKVEGANEKEGKVVCMYGGKTVKEGGINSTPYLQMMQK